MHSLSEVMWACCLIDPFRAKDARVYQQKEIYVVQYSKQDNGWLWHLQLPESLYSTGGLHEVKSTRDDYYV